MAGGTLPPGPAGRRSTADDAVHPTLVPAYAPYAEGKFVPAGTPVIIRVKDESGVLNLTLPSIETVAPVSCIFSGEYLEQKLSTEFLHNWILKKQQNTFVQIDPEWQNCEFEYPGWVH